MVRMGPSRRRCSAPSSKASPVVSINFISHNLPPMTALPTFLPFLVGRNTVPDPLLYSSCLIQTTEFLPSRVTLKGRVTGAPKNVIGETLLGFLAPLVFPFFSFWSSPCTVPALSLSGPKLFVLPARALAFPLWSLLYLKSNYEPCPLATARLLPTLPEQASFV